MSLFNEMSVNRQSISVVGVSFENRQDNIIELIKNKGRVRILAEPENKYDKNAIRVETDKGKLLGYIPKEIAKSIHGRYAKPSYVDYSIYGGGEKRYNGMSISIN